MEIDLKALTYAELCQLIHDIAEELAQRYLDLLALMGARD